MYKMTIPLAALAVAASWTSIASAETIRFAGVLDAGCTLIVTDGLLAANSDYTILSSEEVGGESARLDVTPLGGAVKIDFGPLIFNSDTVTYPTKTEIKWRTQSGFSRGYSDPAPQQYLSSNPEIYEVDVRATAPGGFDAGDFEILTIATCSS